VTECNFVTFKRYVRSREAIDIGVTKGLSFIVKLEEEVTNASILYEMPCKEGNERF